MQQCRFFLHVSLLDRLFQQQLDSTSLAIAGFAECLDDRRRGRCCHKRFRFGESFSKASVECEISTHVSSKVASVVALRVSIEIACFLKGGLLRVLTLPAGTDPAGTDAEPSSVYVRS